VVVHSQEYLCYTLYNVKAKKISKELVWQIIMDDGEWCGSWRVRKGKFKEKKIVQMQMI
jgi:hypothetical protein